MNNPAPSAVTEQQLLALVRQFLVELGAERAQRALTLTASLERDLGIGSLEKAELLHRIETAFGLRLPDQVLAETDTLQELLQALQQAQPPSTRQAPQPVALTPLQREPTEAQTLLEVLRQYAEHAPERPHIYWQDEQNITHIITYGQLWTQANQVAAGLIQRGLKAGEAVALLLPTGEAFFYGFFGILLAGGIPAPLYPPLRASDVEVYAKRAVGILRNAEARFLITFQQAETLSKLLSALVPSLKAVTTVAALTVDKPPNLKVKLAAENPALIQYTSGSTGQPKGVLLTHQNLLANIRAYGQAAAVRPDDVVVSWLPLYHDMGLIGAWLGSLYYGLPLTVLSPLTFLNRPEQWLWTIHYQRATLSAGPNFAYELCLRKIDEQALVGLDLSCWRLAFNGAEAIYPNTLTRFTQRFARYGFRPTTFFPVYGLAECTVALTFPPPQRAPRIDRIARAPFTEQQRAVPANEKDKDYLEFVSCGKPFSDHEIRVVDAHDQPLAERQVGSLQFRGPSAMQGYYRNPSATQAAYHDGWWDTGDLAYIANEELYITGRKKDLIIKAGRNFYPAEIEEIGGQVPEIRQGCVAAFGVHDARQGTEKLILVAETREPAPANQQAIRMALNERVAAGIGMPPDEIVLVPPRTIPKTSSGKLQRSACKQAYLQGKLTRPKAPAWTQVAHLFVRGVRDKCLRAAGRFGRLLYTGYIGLLLTLLLPFWLAALALPCRLAARLYQRSARWLLRLAGCPLQVQGKEHATQAAPVIFVANHASYIDAVVLVSVLPSGVALIGKHELLRVPLLASLMKKLDYLVVHREDFGQSLSDAQKVAECVKNGRSVLLFAEGTFTYATGLRPFKLGAFKLAVDTNVPICPIALRGTRAILRSGTWLPRPGAIQVHIAEPIYPRSQEWDEAVRLRALARTLIARHCGEPPVDWVSASVPVRPPPTAGQEG